MNFQHIDIFFSSSTTALVDLSYEFHLNATTSVLRSCAFFFRFLALQRGIIYLKSIQGLTSSKQYNFMKGFFVLIYL